MIAIAAVAAAGSVVLFATRPRARRGIHADDRAARGRSGAGGQLLMRAGFALLLAGCSLIVGDRREDPDLGVGDLGASDLSSSDSAPSDLAANDLAMRDLAMRDLTTVRDLLAPQPDLAS